MFGKRRSLSAVLLVGRKCCVEGAWAVATGASVCLGGGQ